MSPNSPTNDYHHVPLPHPFDNSSKEPSIGNNAKGRQSSDTIVPPLPRLQRLLSPNELSYYLPSRAYGANDMCVCYELWAPPELMTASRLLLAWSILRLRHPLISSRISHLKPKPPLHQNQPISSAKKAELDEYYRSAAFILDPPSSPEVALEQSQSTLDARLAEHEKMKSEDLLWDFYNGPRILSSEKLVAVTVVKSDTQGQEAIAGPASETATKSYRQTRTRDPGSKREQYVVHFSLMHGAVDGLTMFVLFDELLQILGASSSAIPSSPALSNQQTATIQAVNPALHVPRTEAQLRLLLCAEWALRYGTTSSLHQMRKGEWNGFAFMPASFEARTPPFADRKAAVDDFEQDQAKFEGGHTLLRQSPSNPLSLSTSTSAHKDFLIHLSTRERTQAQPATPNRHNVTRNLVFPPNETRQILNRCKAKGVSVQTAMFAVANVAWLRMLDRARHAIRPGIEQKSMTSAGVEAMKAWAQKCGGPTLMYSAVNLRQLVGYHEHPLRIPEAFRSSLQAQAGWRRQNVVMRPTAAFCGGAETSVLQPDPAYVALGYFNVQLSDGVQPKDDMAAINDFWARAREAKRQTAEAIGSPHMIARNVLMSEERGARSVRFAMEDDGYVPRPRWAAGLPTRAASTNASPSLPSSPPLPKPAPIPAPIIKAAPAAALMGLSLMGNVDATWSYHLYPTITPTLCHCGTRKAYGGSLVIVWSCREALYVNFGWDEKAFPEFDAIIPDGKGLGGVGMRALYQDMREVIAEFILDGAELNVEGDRQGLDMSGRIRLQEWDESHYAVPLLPSQQEDNFKPSRHVVGQTSGVIQLARL
ncbi:hypothetical protein DL93DRAFT_2226469 [Clavulina sp. PMI_390]|nr:hypothetical protein DL93DRAFT_2226469 [Clavulina sp. PMI_390]